MRRLAGASKAEDIDRADAAARMAFDGPWSKFKPCERHQVLLKHADLVERHFDETQRARHARADQPDPAARGYACSAC